MAFFIWVQRGSYNAAPILPLAPFPLVASHAHCPEKQQKKKDKFRKKGKSEGWNSRNVYIFIFDRNGTGTYQANIWNCCESPRGQDFMHCLFPLLSHPTASANVPPKLQTDSSLQTATPSHLYLITSIYYILIPIIWSYILIIDNPHMEKCWQFSCIILNIWTGTLLKNENDSSWNFGYVQTCKFLQGYESTLDQMSKEMHFWNFQ